MHFLSFVGVNLGVSGVHLLFHEADIRCIYRNNQFCVYAMEHQIKTKIKKIGCECSSLSNFLWKKWEAGFLYCQYIKFPILHTQTHSISINELPTQGSHMRYQQKINNYIIFFKVFWDYDLHRPNFFRIKFHGFEAHLPFDRVVTTCINRNY